MILRPFEVKSPRGGSLRGELRVREGPPPRSAVAVVHGFKGFRDWGFFPYLCTALAAEGHAVVSFDFALNGMGPDRSRFSDLDAFRRNTLTRELDELRAILALLASGALTPRRPRSLGVMGHSRGGALALLAAREDPGVAALVTWGAVSRFDRWTAETVEEWRRRGETHVFDQRTGQHLPLGVDLLDDFLANRERLDLVRAASELRAPWLIVHGRDDLTVSEAEGRELARASGRARLVLVEGAGHTFEVGHPFPGPTAGYREALDATVLHFRGALGEG